jgi:subtilase family serine protease
VAVKNRLLKAGGFAVLGLGLTALTGALVSGAAAAKPTNDLVAVAGSVSPTTDRITGGYKSSKMQIEVAIAPRDQVGMNSLIAGLYDKNSALYHKWLTPGQFDAQFAPTPSSVNAVASFLSGSGLTLLPSSSPFLVRAAGTSSQISGAFHTTLSTYVDPRGITYFANSTPVLVPSGIAGDTQGVIGLTNTARFTTNTNTPRIYNTWRPWVLGGNASCETGYVTKQQLFNFVNNGTGFSNGFGGGPGCSGLTPSQTNSIYSAPNVGPSGKGAGVNLAVFELSAYQESDIDTWAHQFYGPGYTPPLQNITVDGGPLAPVCPSGDTCPPSFNGYAGDIEVDADIEMGLAIAPDVAHLQVYNAPNDFTGQTELDEYSAIASQDTADVVSSSWAVCESDINNAYAEAENTIFSKMAADGQSMFSSAGDTGAFECIRTDGTDQTQALDPSVQPYVTSVGGTTLDIDNPRTNPRPSYPGPFEAVWNVDGLCSQQGANAGNDEQGGYFWCAETGAGGGAPSIRWAAPPWQQGPGVVSSSSTYGCTLSLTGGTAPANSLCRETPDVSADADEYTGYSEYCTGNASTPYSVCANINTTPHGWFEIGGTSLSSPLWAAIFADRDSYQGKRSGNAAAFLYGLFNSNPSAYFHDITQFGHDLTGLDSIPTNNGEFQETTGYDMATGIGTPIMRALITAR